MKITINRNWLRNAFATLVVAGLFTTTAAYAEENEAPVEKTKSKLIDKDTFEEIEKSLPSDLPKKIKEKILKAIESADLQNIEIDVDEDVDQDGGKSVEMQVITFGKGMILEPDGQVSDFKWEGPGKSNLKGMDSAIRERILSVMKDNADGRKVESINVKDGSVEVKREGKIVVVNSDGDMKTFYFGDGEDSQKLEDILPELPKRLAEQRAGHLKSLALRSRMGEAKKRQVKTTDVESKLDAILDRLTKIETELETLKAK